MLSSVSLFASANAGELGVSGTAKATYNIQSGKTNAGKGLGITNELNFTASGELDNGYTWSYSMELDPGATTPSGSTDTSPGNAQNDDTKMTLTTPYGTVGVFISEGGLDVEDAASQSAYARPTDMGGSDGVVDNFNIDGYNNMQYHTPGDLIPFGGSFKIAYAPDLDTYGSGNNSGVTKGDGVAGYTGRSATEMQVSFDAIPMADGLKIGASYFDFDKQGDEGKKDQEAESGAYYATYSIGNVSLGYSKAYKALLISDDAMGGGSTTQVEYYDQSNQSIAYAVNDDLTISYEVEKSEANYLADATAAVEQKSSGVQLAYNLGGMTLAIARNSHDNPSYSSTAADLDQTLIAVTMAF